MTDLRNKEFENGCRLREKISNLEEKVHRLKMSDHIETIDAYCNELANSVRMNLKDAIRHLTELTGRLVKEIEEYRSSLKRCERDEESQLTMMPLSNDIHEYAQQAYKFLSLKKNQVADHDFKKAQDKLAYFDDQLEDLECRIRKSIFGNRFLHYEVNRQFFTMNQHCGILKCFSKERTSSKGYFNVIRRQICTLENHKQATTVVQFMEDGKLLSGSTDKSIFLWDQDKTEFGLRYDSEVFSLAQLQKGLVAFGFENGSIAIRQIKSKTSDRFLKTSQRPVVSLTALPNGRLASLAYDNIIKIWDPYLDSDESLVTEIRCSDDYGCEVNTVGPLALTSKGFLVNCTHAKENSVVNVVNALSGRLFRRISTHLPEVSCLVVLQDENIVLGSLNGTIKLLNLASQSEFRVLTGENASMKVFSLLAMPNGYFLASVSEENPRIQVWNPANGQLIETLATDHTGPIVSMSLSPDKRTLATGSLDSKIKLWRVST